MENVTLYTINDEIELAIIENHIEEDVVENGKDVLVAENGEFCVIKNEDGFIVWSGFLSHSVSVSIEEEYTQESFSLSTQSLVSNTL